MNRQKVILAILLLILVVALLRAFLVTPVQQVAPTAGTLTGGDKQNPAAVSAKANQETMRVKISLLDPEKAKYHSPRRDIFNFYTPKPKPVKKEVKDPTPPPPPPPPPPIDKNEVIQRQVRQQLASFTFLGFLIKDEVPTVFLSKRDELFLVKRADFFGDNNQFEVIEITETLLTIRQKGAGSNILIELVEEEPLVPSFMADEPDGRSAVRPQVPASGDIRKTTPQVPPREQRKRWFKNVPPEAEK